MLSCHRELVFRKALFLSTFLLFVSIGEMKHYHSFMGPYRVVIKNIERCPADLDGEAMEETTIRMVRMRKNLMFLISVNGTLPLDIDDSIKARVSVASWSNMGGWTPNAHIIQLPSACKAVKDLTKNFWLDISNRMYGEYQHCPFYAGIYRAENVTLDMGKMGIPYLLYGKWRVDVQALSPEMRPFACIRMYCDTVPN